MAEKKTVKKTRGPATKGKTRTGFTADERAAMKARARELKAEGARQERAEGNATCSRRSPRCRRIGSRHGQAAPCDHHGQAAPDLSPKTWYGMPAYAKDGKVVCFFKAAEKFDARYATFGFEDAANVDTGAMWPTSWALTELTAADEKKIAALVKKAVR